MKNWEKHRKYLETGDFHVHTNYTDGHNTVREMCEQALRNGLGLICFAEHVRKELYYDYGSLVEDIEAARKLFPKLKILTGCEAKVLDPEGNLDVSGEILDRSEIVIASFHGFPYGAKGDFLRALLCALKRPRVDIWGHPATFLQNIDFTWADLETIIRTCMKNRVLIENSLASIYRTPPGFLEMCRKLGATVVTNSDAHTINDLKMIR